jgi:hypothetical protein
MESGLIAFGPFLSSRRYAQSTLLVLCLASSACATFEKTSSRGSLIDFENPKVSNEYRGLWAFPESACFATGDRGVQMFVDENMIGNAAVKTVRGYSDYPDIEVELEAEGERESGLLETLFLQLSRDGTTMRVRSSQHSKAKIFYRCLLK